MPDALVPIVMLIVVVALLTWVSGGPDGWS